MNKEMKSKIFTVKAIEESTKTISAYVSDYQWDRTRERFVKGSWSLDNYKRNPVVLWAHDQKTPPIAKAILLSEDDNGLFAQAQFNESDEFSMRIFSLYQKGFLSAFSVGFIPMQSRMEEMDQTSREKGIVWTEAELLEFSAVAVPANPGAIVRREDAELIAKTLGENFLTKTSDGFILQQPKEKETEEQENKEMEMEQPDFESTLKSLIDLAKTAKGGKLDEQKVQLVKTCASVLQELVLENSPKEMSEKEFKELVQVVKSWLPIINSKTDKRELVSKFAMQFEMAIRGYHGN